MLRWECWIGSGRKSKRAVRGELEIVHPAEQARIMHAPVGTQVVTAGTVHICYSHGDAHCPRRGDGISIDCITSSFNSCISFFSRYYYVSMDISLRHCRPGSCIKTHAQHLLVYSRPFPPSPGSLAHTYPDRHSTLNCRSRQSSEQRQKSAWQPPPAQHHRKYHPRSPQWVTRGPAWQQEQQEWQQQQRRRRQTRLP